MKIIFLGTPEFAVPSLDILVKNGYDITGVVTAPGKKAGRGLQVREPAIKIYAESHGLQTFQPLKLNDQEFIAQLKSLQADLFIVVAFRMLPEAIWKMPPLGTFNLHGSLLPQYRGAAPINRAIMNGEPVTGVTTFFLKHEIDTGQIIFNEKITIHPNETAGELHDRMKETGAQLVLKTVRAIESGNISPVSQETLITSGSELLQAPKIFTEDCRIDWNKDAISIHNQVRGLSPFPGAFTWLKDRDGNELLLKIFRTALSRKTSGNVPGTIITEQERFYIQCSDVSLELLEIQQEGKKRIAASDFIKGFRTEKGYKAV